LRKIMGIRLLHKNVEPARGIEPPTCGYRIKRQFSRKQGKSGGKRSVSLRGF
jgi:hypothetical protein